VNKDELKGKIDQAKGYAKEKIGEITNDPELELEGKVDKAGGKVREAYGQAKRETKEVVDRVKESPHKP
jgi:uncharacterized protein YjbJ (UPF0337 family)